jgi:hypothetical protein
MTDAQTEGETETAGGDGGLVQLLLIEREAALARLRQIEDMLLAAGAIHERRVMSQRLMRRLYAAFGEEAVKEALAE